MAVHGRGYTGDRQTREEESLSFDSLHDYVYSDLDFIFKPTLAYQEAGLSGDVAKKFDGDAIKQSVKNIVLTNTYERPWKPTMGCNIRNLLFEDIEFDFFETFQIQEKIKNQLGLYEPRITVENVSIATSDKYQDTLNISISYKLKTITKLSNPRTVIVKIAVKRIR